MTDPGELRVKLLQLKDPAMADGVLSIQRSAYRVEAELLGVTDLPPMAETREDLLRSRETFWGCYESGTLVGVLSTEERGDLTEIGRLAVSPSHFRRGVATKLIAHALAMAGPDATVRVSTGAANAPALALYERFGFRPTGSREVLPGVHLTTLMRPPETP